jgi:hypothetical protein
LKFKFNDLALCCNKIKAINHYFCAHKLIQLAGGMQSNQFKSDTLQTNLHLNGSISGDITMVTDTVAPPLSLFDPSFNDSLSVNYIAPDSIIYYGFRQEWSQFKTGYNNQFDYKSKLVQPLPYDSLHTVLKNVEVVFAGKKLMRSNPDWLVGVLLISFLLFASVRLIFNKYLSQLMQSTINYSTFTRTFREKYFNLLHASFRLDLVFSMVFSLFCYQFLTAYKISLGVSKSYYTYLYCLGIVIGYFLAKRIVYYIIGILTESKADVQEYLFSITVFNRVMGIFLLPITATIAFIPINQVELLLIIGFVIIGIFYLMSLLRGGKIFLKKHFSISYLILYLCTLEFVPLILIYNLLLI